MLALQELGDTAPFINSNESGLKRRCIVMLELSATLARVLEFLTSRLPDIFLSGSPLNLSRFVFPACHPSVLRAYLDGRTFFPDRFAEVSPGDIASGCMDRLHRGRPLYCACWV